MELLYDAVSILLLPLPGLFEESLAAQIMLVNPLALQLVDYFYLCGNSRMVGSRLPEGLVSLHPLIAD